MEQNTGLWSTGVMCTLVVYSEGETAQLTTESSEWAKYKSALHAESRRLFDEAAEKYNPPAEQICPLLIWTQELIDEVPYERDDCKSYIAKARTDFITGVMDIENDADWQKYLAQLDTLGLETWQFYSQYIYEETVAGRWQSDILG